MDMYKMTVIKYISLINKRIKGNNTNVGYIDTATVIIPFNLWKNIKWKLDIYEAHDNYTKECCDNKKDKHVHI